MAHPVSVWLQAGGVALRLQVGYESGPRLEEQVPSEMAFPGEGLAQRCHAPWSLWAHSIRMAQFFWQTRLPCMLAVGGPGRRVLVPCIAGAYSLPAALCGAYSPPSEEWAPHQAL